MCVCVRARELQVNKRMTAAPPIVRTVFSSLAIVELDTGAILHAACFHAYPFTTQLIEFAVSLATTALVLIAFNIPNPRRIVKVRPVASISDCFWLGSRCTNFMSRSLCCHHSDSPVPVSLCVFVCVCVSLS